MFPEDSDIFIDPMIKPVHEFESLSWRETAIVIGAFVFIFSAPLIICLIAVRV